jgi:hypothetical protein
MKTIFIQIASYRDPELIPTVQDAIAQATSPELLSFGICWQYKTKEELYSIDALRSIKNCRIKAVPIAKTRGVGWARSRVQKLWQGERYTLQIDSHMRFASGWDTLLIDMLAMCPSSKPILTAYPPPYEPPRNLLANTPTRVVPHRFSKAGVLFLGATGDLRQYSAPQPGAFIAAGFMFADASIIQKVPYDPNIYYTGEEVLFSARAWTRGWDIYHPHRVVCWHYYRSTSNSTKERFQHWTDHQDWSSFNAASEHRFKQIIGMEPQSQKFGVYGLGTVRTLAEYEAIAGPCFRDWSKHSEVELLLCCARTCIDPETAEQIRTLLQENIDWVYLIQTAAQHGVIPLLYHSLNTTCPKAVPKAILSQLRDYFHSNASYNLLLTSELLKLVNLFETHEIRAIPWKGPVLAASSYNNLALRQFGDLDILVHERDFLRAMDLLISQGYRATDERYLLFDTHEAAYLKSCHEYSLMSDDGRVLVDLHKKILGRRFLDFDHLWAHLETISLVGTTVVNLQPEDLLLSLCAHGSRHLWQRLIWICDVAELVRVRQEMDWEQLIEQARTQGCERMLLHGLLLASELLGATLPEKVYQRIQAEPVSKSLTTQVRERLFCRTDDPSKGFNFEMISYHFRMLESWQDIVNYLVERFYWHCLVPAQRVFTPTFQDHLFLPLPPSLYFLYYPIRPIRLVRKSLIRLMRLLGKSGESV